MQISVGDNIIIKITIKNICNSDIFRIWEILRSMALRTVQGAKIVLVKSKSKNEKKS